MPKEFPLTQGFVTLVDSLDFSLLLRIGKRWQVAKRGKTNYAISDFPGRSPKRVYLHRWLTDAPVGVEVDHVNGDGLDNRRLNLRMVSRAENAMNRHGRDVEYAGVRRAASISESWAAYVNTNGRQIYLGCWADKRLAASARDEYVREHFPTASLNFPDDSPFSTSEIANARIAQKRNRFPGIRFKRGAWEAWARLNGRKRYLGRFKTEEEAWLARQSFLSI